MAMSAVLATMVGAAVNPVTPSSSGLPIGTGVNTIMSWVMWGALVLCAAGAMVSGGVVAFANHTGRPDLSIRAKTSMLWSLAGGFLIGAAIPLVNAFFGIA